ncbi:MAG TPA: metallophosphoesterase [Clostridia bacterium]|nr:metallophosphoesterase [Clostridia bacterium]
MTRWKVSRLLAAVVFVFALLLSNPAAAQVKIAQISDSHIGLARAPEGSDNLRKVVRMVNDRNPDIVVVSGDIGERPSAWDDARKILGGLKAKVYYIPGNHDVHSTDVDRYRRAFGDDYYKIRVKNVVIYALDSQLLGNWDKFEARTEPPVPKETQAEADKMLNWLSSDAKGAAEDRGEGRDRDKGRDKDKNKGRGDKDKGRKDNKGEGRGDAGDIVLAMQHVPAVRAGGFPNDSKPYWVVNDPYRSRELDALKKLGVRHILAGHWHRGMVFDAAGFTWHVAPATSWSPFGAKLGFAMHTVSPDGKVNTQFVYLDGSTE